MPNIGPNDKTVELETETPEEVEQSMKDWETSMLEVQREEDVKNVLAMIDKAIADNQRILDGTGARVNPNDNVQGAITQKGYEKAIQALKGVKDSITVEALPLAAVVYEDEPNFEDDETV